jgi:uncharacterized protein YeaO (DUF488 family)
MIRLKRVYQPRSSEDGFRVLVDRLWPRGLTKEQVGADRWLKEAAPSPELRTWFGHDPARWEEFRRRYQQELESKAELMDFLLAKSREGVVPLIYAARDERHNAAAALKEFLEEQRHRLKPMGPAGGCAARRPRAAL